jgi:hypothetical protein
MGKKLPERNMAIVETYEPIGTLKAVAEGVWIADGPVIRYGYLGLRFPFPTRMTVLRLANGGLWLHSPTELSPALRREVDALGAVEHLIAPNRIHYWWLGEWAAAYPEAATHAAPGVRKQARRNTRFAAYQFDLTPAMAMAGNASPWPDEIDMLVVPGGYLSEAVFLHRASRTLILTDLIQNYERLKIASPLFRFMSRLSGAADPDGKMPFDLRLTFFWHRKPLAAAVRQMIAWEPERIIIAHGRCYEGNAVAELKRAFRWLPGV